MNKMGLRQNDKVQSEIKEDRLTKCKRDVAYVLLKYKQVCNTRLLLQELLL